MASDDVLSERIVKLLTDRGPQTPGQLLGALMNDTPELTRQEIVSELLALEVADRIAIKSDWMVSEIAKKADSVNPRDDWSSSP